MERLHQHRVRIGGLLAFLPLAVVTACGDLNTDPEVELTTVETVPTLHLKGPLPSLPEVVSEWGEGLPMDGVVETWRASWDRPPAEGRAQRDELYQATSALLAARISRDDLEELDAGLGSALEAVEDLMGGPLPMTLELPLTAARASQEAAAAAMMAGDHQKALYHLLRAVDHVRSATPEATARTLVREAEELLGSFSALRTYSEETTRRADRLLYGSREALRRGEHSLALQRAFYAYQLLADESGR